MECNRRHSYLLRICRLFGVHYSDRHRGRHCASGSRSPELSAQVVRADSCKSCIPSHTDASISRPGRNGWEYVEDGRGRRLRAFVVWMWTKACLSRLNTFHSRYTKPPNSRNCKQHRMWELGTHARWNYHTKPSYDGKIISFVEVESLCGATGYPLRAPRLEDTVLDAHTREPVTVITQWYLGVLRFCRWSQPGHYEKSALFISEIRVERSHSMFCTNCHKHPYKKNNGI